MKLMMKEEVVAAAKSYAAEGFLCSESVLLALSNWLGIPSSLIPRIATGFGAGICLCGSLCGAVCGGVMALSIKFGRNEAKVEKTVLYQLGQKLVKTFEAEFGSIMCRELTGCDLQTEAGLKKYEEEEIWEKTCRRYIGSVTSTIYDLIAGRT